jgi:cytoskeletal protein RodZ
MNLCATSSIEQQANNSQQERDVLLSHLGIFDDRSEDDRSSRPRPFMLPSVWLLVVVIVFFIGNKNLSEVKDKQETQDISEISDQIQKNSN